MLIITLSSPKQQVVGQRNQPCAGCRQVTPHRVQRHYVVKHVFWFPLFSMSTIYATVCERCNHFEQTSAPAAGSVPPKPFLHRMGFLFPIAVVMFPFFLLPLAVVGAGASGGTHADTASARELFFAAEADRAAQSDLQRQFDNLRLPGLTVKVSSADAGGVTIRIIAAKFSRLKNLRDRDRQRLLEIMEDTADQFFPNNEVFLGVQGRILWGGYSHRQAGEEWRRKVAESTDSPEREAVTALREAQAAIARASADTAGAAATAAAAAR